MSARPYSAAMSMDPSFVRSRGTSSAGSFRAAVGRAAAAAATGDYEDGDGYGAAEGGLTPHGHGRAQPDASITSVGSGIMDGAEMLAKAGGLLRTITRPSSNRVHASV